MRTLLQTYRTYLHDTRFVFSVVCSIALLAASLVVNFYAGMYVTERASNSVTDVVLSNTRVYDVDGFFVYGFVVLVAFITLLCILDPGKVPFTAKSVALFVFIRSLFMTLTHIGPFPTMAAIDSNILKDFTFGADLFFSGHTGLPFLMALMFWNRVYLRVVFIAAAVFFGTVVLLGHLHYSIDVAAAFFITYTIFHLAEMIFKKDRARFLAS